jgi:glycosyltransferase involved in cell wall biosynthesis
LAHDYLTQRGGAERVAAIMAEAFPGAPLHTTLYEPDATFDDFRKLTVRTTILNRVPLFRRDHRLALPFYAPVVSGMSVDAEVLLASSSGWAHGIDCTGRKVVYCHAPARWLYQTDRYVGADQGGLGARARRSAMKASLAALAPSLRRWDQRRAQSADRYLVNSSVIREMVQDVYGIEAEVLPPPPALNVAGTLEAVEVIREPFVLCVARLLPYKNVDTVISAVKGISGLSLAIVGRGPDHDRLRELIGADPSIHLLGGVSEESLRWLYTYTLGLVAASYEDFGLTPLEAASFGKPTAALHAGGYLDTIEPQVNGLFFEQPDAGSVADGVADLVSRTWDAAAVRAHADSFGKARFCERLRNVVDSVR